METNRSTAYLNRKQRLILTKQGFPFIDKLEVGEKGQLLAKVSVQRMDLNKDMDGNDMMEVDLKVGKAEIVDNKKARDLA